MNFKSDRQLPVPATGENYACKPSCVGNLLLALLLAACQNNSWGRFWETKTEKGGRVDIDATGLFAWYKLDGDLTDASGNANHGALSSGVFTGTVPGYSTDRSGSATTAATFNGSTQYFVNNFVAQCDKDFTVSFWIRPAQTASAMTIMGFETGISANPGFHLDMQAGGAARQSACYVAGGANTDSISAIGAPLSSSQWQHYAYVQDSTSRTGILYLDGVASAPSANSGGTYTCSGASPVTGVQQWWNGNPLTIGYGFNGSFFSGTLDEIRFYHRKVSFAEIQILAIF